MICKFQEIIKNIIISSRMADIKKDIERIIEGRIMYRRRRLRNVRLVLLLMDKKNIRKNIKKKKKKWKLRI